MRHLMSPLDFSVEELDKLISKSIRKNMHMPVQGKN